MEEVKKLVTILGAIAVVVGLFWGFSGFMDYLQGRKNRDKNKQDEGLEAIIYGAAVSGVSAAIATAISTAITNIKF